MDVPWRKKKSSFGLLKLLAVALGAFAVVHSTPDLIREVKLYRM